MTKEIKLDSVLKIDKQMLKEISEIGSGGFGKVYYSTYLTNKFAVKKSRKPTNEDFFKELCIITIYRHIYTPRFIGISTDKKSKISLVFELIDGDTLEQSVHKLYNNKSYLSLSSNVLNNDNNSNPKLNQGNMIKHKSFIEQPSNHKHLELSSNCSSNKNYEDDDKNDKLLIPSIEISLLLNFIDLSSILVYLHGFSLIHRDLKPGNIIFEKNGNCRLLDFGISKKTNHTETIAETGGTIIYMAPENFDHNNNINDTDTYTTRCKVSTKVDIWAFGCILSQVYSGEKPWVGKGITDNRTILAKLFKYEKFPIPSSVGKKSKHIEALIMRCIENNHERRICSNVLKYYMLNILFTKLSELKQITGQLTIEKVSHKVSQSNKYNSNDYLKLLKIQSNLKCFLEINQYLIENGFIAKPLNQAKNYNLIQPRIEFGSFSTRKVNFDSQEYCNNLGCKLYILIIIVVAGANDPFSYENNLHKATIKYSKRQSKVNINDEYMNDSTPKSLTKRKKYDKNKSNEDFAIIVTKENEDNLKD